MWFTPPTEDHLDLGPTILIGIRSFSHLYLTTHYDAMNLVLHVLAPIAKEH